jgi:hypothetical protein
LFFNWNSIDCDRIFIQSQPALQFKAKAQTFVVWHTIGAVYFDRKTTKVFEELNVYSLRKTTQIV